MTNPSSASLRLFVEQLPDEQPSLDLPQLAALTTAFEQATGWQLRREQCPAGPGEVWATTISDGNGGSAGRLVLSRSNAADDERQPAAAPLDLQRARPLALAIGQMLGEMNRLRRAVWQREAELAAGVPVAARPNDEPHLAERLESVLKGGAEAVECQAAGLYLLDENTSELKLRAAYNLPQHKLLESARPLRGAVADLEALVGHAVVLEDTTLLPHWRCPEDFPAAVCVPVSSPTMPLGTLWVFSERARDFSPQETNLVEIIAGRLAADLEREMLLAAGTAAKCRDQELDRAARWLSDRLPSISPMLDEYEVAGWTRGGDAPAATFHDWSVLADGRLAVALGDSHGQSLTAALGAASLQAAFKSHTSYPHGVAQLLARVNDTLWTASPGDQTAALAYALIAPEQGSLELALAGGMAAILVRGDDDAIYTANGPALGEGPDVRFDCQQMSLAEGQVLVLLSGGLRAAVDQGGLRIGEAAFASSIRKHLRDSASGLLARLRRLIEHQQQPANDMSLVIVKRRRERS